MLLKPHDDVLCAHLDGEAVLLHMGSKRYYRLNDTAAAVWRALERGPCTLEELTGRMAELFDGGLEAMRTEIERLVVSLRERRLLAPPPGS